MQDWEFIFGDTLECAVHGVIGKAVQKDTVAAFQKAIAKLEGIDFFVTCMQCRKILGPDATIRIGNEIRRLEEALRLCKELGITVEVTKALKMLTEEASNG